jgi:hypothetical protein
MPNPNSTLKFEHEYPSAFAHFTTEDGFMKGSGRLDECVYCDGPANWFSKALGLYFCCRDCFTHYVAEKGAAAGNRAFQE